jgi:hypothetical protein
MLYNNIQKHFRHYHDLLAGICPGPPLTIPSIRELLTYMLPLKYEIRYFVQYPCILNINLMLQLKYIIPSFYTF